MWRLVVPSLKVSGGIREVLRLADTIVEQGGEATLVSLWASPRAMQARVPVHFLSRLTPNAKLALLQLPLLLVRFVLWRRSAASACAQARFVFTHYVTLPFSIFVPAGNRFFFVQDLEWKFVHPLLSWLVRAIILSIYRRGRIISANSYLTRTLQTMNLSVAHELAIWADPAFRVAASESRDIDFAMMLRKGGHKRLDLYRSFIAKAREHGNLRLAVISPEDEIVDSFRDSCAVALCRPTESQMRALFARTKCFLHLSDHEGFGLPPLEAMGAGCVPLCRDSGGIRAFMSPALESLILPLSMEIDEIFERALQLISDEDRLHELERTSREVFERGLEASARARANVSTW